MLLVIQRLTKDHYPAVKQIYEQGIKTGLATFETSAPDWLTFDKKYLPHSRLVVLENKEVAGWATLSAVSKRAVYRGVTEISIYISAEKRGKRIGDFLMKRVLESSENHGVWTVQAVIFEENLASVKLHENNGFRLVGYREKIGQMDGIWMSNLLFERRSKLI